MPTPDPSPIQRTPAGWRLPGIANLHSHAFQRAMAGLAERQTDPADSFWTWRETMYRMAARFDPDSLHAVALQLYVEMLEAGYTTVCEFHYLHHAPDGSAYATPTAMSDALVAAAREAGIRMTLLPVLYMTGGFDGRALGERQKRFGHDVESYLRLFEALHARRQEQQSPHFRERMKQRAAIEGTISALVRKHGARRARYRGQEKVRLQSLTIGAAHNVKNAARALAHRRRTTARLMPIA